MRIGSLFSGIGGLELGLEWSGLGHTVWQVERDEYCRRVLERHWPGVERFDDVCAVGASTLAPVDVICGGFPCQDVSSAGKGAGLAGSRSGLWFEFRRIVEEMRPEWVVIENVASGGNRWVDAVTGHLEELGYGSIPFPLSAFDVGAPHLRKRIFIVAADTKKVMGESNMVLSQLRDLGESKDERDGVVPWSSSVAHTRGMDDGIPNRMDRRGALGNSVVPQCSEVIGHIIRELEGARLT